MAEYLRQLTKNPFFISHTIPIFVLLLTFVLFLSYPTNLHATFPNGFINKPFCGVDAQTHHQRALGLISGQYPGDKPWLFIPFYPAYLATLYVFLGIDFFFPVVVQSIFNLITCAALYAIGRYLFSNLAGTLATLAFVLYAPFIYYLPCYDQSLLTVPFFTLTVFFLFKFQANRQIRWLVFAAICVALSALSRPTILIIVPAVLLWLFIYRISFKRFLLEALGFAGLVLILISPITWHNYQTSGLFIPLSKNGGVNLFTGNNPDASGLDSLAHVQSQPAVLRHVELQKRRISGETTYSAEVFKYIREQPGDWIQLTGRKVWLWFGEADRPLISPFFSQTIEESMILRWLPIEWQAMAFTALLGLVLAKSRQHQANMLVWLVYGFFSLATILFFIQLRFRLPFVPIVVIYAMALVTQASNWIQQNQKRYWLVLIVLLAMYLILPSLWIFILIYSLRGLWAASKPSGDVVHRWTFIVIWSYLVVGGFFIHSRMAANDVSQTIAHYLGPRLVGQGILGQTLQMDCDGFDSLWIKMGTFDNNHDQPVTLFLTKDLDAQQTLLAGQFDGSKVQDNTWLHFEFEPLPDSNRQTYFFFITSPTSTVDNSLTTRGYSDVPIDYYKSGQAYAGALGSLQKIEADFAFVATCQQSLWQKLLAGVDYMATHKVWVLSSTKEYWIILGLHLVLLIVSTIGIVISLRNK
ncbi:MAG: glycosyltransferase family 39 protein [Anaerolineae bacterium]|nr:glycosyltransferase family 39 protein [Anaerolineae bacterium]